MMRLGIDAMGGDFAPEECIKGVKRFSDLNHDGITIVLFGDESAINSEIKRVGGLHTIVKIKPGVFARYLCRASCLNVPLTPTR